MYAVRTVVGPRMVATQTRAEAAGHGAVGPLVRSRMVIELIFDVRIGVWIRKVTGSGDNGLDS